MAKVDGKEFDTVVSTSELHFTEGKVCQAFTSLPSKKQEKYQL
jgi:hypothetical protein